MNISPPLRLLKGDFKAVIKNTDMFQAAPRHMYFESQCPLAVVSSVPKSFWTLQQIRGTPKSVKRQTNLSLQRSSIWTESLQTL